MTPLRDESIRLVEHALAEVLGEADVAFHDRADALVWIAEKFRVSVTDALLPWIHRHAPEKEWSAVEWRHWCEAYAEALEEARQRILRDLLDLPREER